MSSTILNVVSCDICKFICVYLYYLFINALFIYLLASERSERDTLRSVQSRIVDIYIVRANFVVIPVKKAERNFEIAARTLSLRVCGATPRFTAAVKIPLSRQHFSSRIIFDRKLSESYFF